MESSSFQVFHMVRELNTLLSKYVCIYIYKDFPFAWMKYYEYRGNGMSLWGTIQNTETKYFGKFIFRIGSTENRIWDLFIQRPQFKVLGHRGRQNILIRHKAFSGRRKFIRLRQVDDLRGRVACTPVFIWYRHR